jgi:hypothetical protein
VGWTCSPDFANANNPHVARKHETRVFVFMSTPFQNFKS